ncbi:LPS O-antigen length regulator Wzz(fepE) [Scandinavium sp. V105_16]|uniref:LPS O-antigen length regulator Wzz(FepE) n=1 Tax=Scandinavium lactucae TaxID=3095028 RepID=A0AAJ2S8R8_9ENTR|nr:MULTISPECIES: LPS O-antigen length regulator Wzz(fepE) [unclassified Scandinavium]MDX6020492.1 LPS O-antigen length regulator Wzz(fepE) [Scandinavium sp. V105_16]MDX6031956.1 LPS O-antigen length regulator Wzz(fepE) [Scandinavium sp. V105_12]
MSTMDIKPQKDTVVSFPHATPMASFGQEIDLLAMIEILWNAKKRIFSVIFVFAVLGLLVTFFLPQKWTSNAVITPPERVQLTPLNTLLATTKVLGVDANVDSGTLFNLFIKKFNSSVLLEQFITSSPALMSQFNGTDVDPGELHRAIVAISEKMKAVDDASNKKEPATPYSSWTLSFTGPQPEEAQTILAGYTQFVADKVVEQTLSNIHDNVTMNIQIEKQRLVLDRAQMENAKETKIKRLNYSLEVAKAAGINKPVYSKGQTIKDDPDYSVTLGTEGISKKLEIEKSMKDVAELNADILNREYRLKQIEQLDIKNIRFPVVNYQLSPSLPVKKEGPGKAVIILLAALLGGMAGCAGVLLQHARESRRSQNLLDEQPV